MLKILGKGLDFFICRGNFLLGGGGGGKALCRRIVWKSGVTDFGRPATKG